MKILALIYFFLLALSTGAADEGSLPDNGDDVVVGSRGSAEDIGGLDRKFEENPESSKSSEVGEGTEHNNKDTGFGASDGVFAVSEDFKKFLKFLDSNGFDERFADHSNHEQSAGSQVKVTDYKAYRTSNPGHGQQISGGYSQPEKLSDHVNAGPVTYNSKQPKANSNKEIISPHNTPIRSNEVKQFHSPAEISTYSQGTTSGYEQTRGLNIVHGSTGLNHVYGNNGNSIPTGGVAGNFQYSDSVLESQKLPEANQDYRKLPSPSGLQVTSGVPYGRYSTYGTPSLTTVSSNSHQGLGNSGTPSKYSGKAISVTSFVGPVASGFQGITGEYGSSQINTPNYSPSPDTSAVNANYEPLKSTMISGNYPGYILDQEKDITPELIVNQEIPKSVSYHERPRPEISIHGHVPVYGYKNYEVSTSDNISPEVSRPNSNRLSGSSKSYKGSSGLVSPHPAGTTSFTKPVSSGVSGTQFSISQDDHKDNTGYTEYIKGSDSPYKHGDSSKFYGAPSSYVNSQEPLTNGEQHSAAGYSPQGQLKDVQSSVSSDNSQYSQGKYPSNRYPSESVKHDASTHSTGANHGGYVTSGELHHHSNSNNGYAEGPTGYNNQNLDTVIGLQSDIKNPGLSTSLVPPSGQVYTFVSSQEPSTYQRGILGSKYSEDPKGSQPLDYSTTYKVTESPTYGKPIGSSSTVGQYQNAYSTQGGFSEFMKSHGESYNNNDNTASLGTAQDISPGYTYPAGTTGYNQETGANQHKGTSSYHNPSDEGKETNSIISLEPNTQYTGSQNFGRENSFQLGFYGKPAGLISSNSVAEYPKPSEVSNEFNEGDSSYESYSGLNDYSDSLGDGVYYSGYQGGSPQYSGGSTGQNGNIGQSHIPSNGNIEEPGKINTNVDPVRFSGSGSGVGHLDGRTRYHGHHEDVPGGGAYEGLNGAHALRGSGGYNQGSNSHKDSSNAGFGNVQDNMGYKSSYRSQASDTSLEGKGYLKNTKSTSFTTNVASSQLANSQNSADSDYVKSPAVIAGVSGSESNRYSGESKIPESYSDQSNALRNSGGGGNTVGSETVYHTQQNTNQNVGGNAVPLYGQNEYHTHKIVQHVPVEVPYHVPHEVIKHVLIPVKHHVPVPVVKHYPVPVPKPYKVVVEKKVPIHVEKKVPYHVPKPIPYEVPKPYIVHVPKPVRVYVKKTYPVAVYKQHHHHHPSMGGGGTRHRH